MPRTKGSGLRAIRNRLGLYKWAGHFDDAAPGSLEKQFLGEDVPALLDVADAVVIAKHEGRFEPLHDALNHLLDLEEGRRPE
jgi:hypothetical protein